MKKLTLEFYDNEWETFQRMPGDSDKDKAFRAFQAAMQLYTRAGALIRDEELRKKKAKSLIWTPPEA